MHKDSLDGCQHDRRVDVLELRAHSLANVLCFFRVHCLVVCQCGQDRNSAPLGALVQREKHLLEHCTCDDQRVRFRRCFIDFNERSDSVRNDHWVGIADHLL